MPDIPKDWAGGSALPAAVSAYQRILDRPHDDAPRLAYADLLDGSSDELERRHARFVRVQLELVSARRQRSADVDRLSGLSRTLRQGTAPWSRPARDWVDRYQMRRGFIDEVMLSCAAFLDRATDLVRVFPVRHLTVTGADLAGVRDLCASGHLKRMHSLAVHGPIGDDGARALAACADLRGLTWLDLHSCAIGQDGLDAIAASSSLADLAYLGFAGNRVADPRPQPDYDGSTGQILGYIMGPETHAMRRRFPGRRWLEPLNAPDTRFDPPDRDDV